MKNYNPDVLSCLANLSNDEVFTPPALANQILDMLPDKIWHDSTATFLDPVCKSGVFLREIAKRLINGLKNEIPDLQERLNHIFTQQLYGIAITDLTSLLSRRSVYCSKTANGEYSVCTTFKEESGNIRFHEMKHTWKDGKCIYCGASQSVYDRGDDYESHAYEFIHTDDPNVIFNKMKFDVIIGNPPYQLNDGGNGASAKPIYQLFVEQAKKLNPRYLCMIIPARWYSGGKGLDKFRLDMLNDERISEIVDYTNSAECFPGVDVAGGICYFLWDRLHKGKCSFTNYFNGKSSHITKKLNEYNYFIRYPMADAIIQKVYKPNQRMMSSMVSSRKPFGLATDIKPLPDGDILLRYNGGIGRFWRKGIKNGIPLIDKWKVIISYLSAEHAGQPDKRGMFKVLSSIELLKPGSVCTETYLLVGSYNSESEAQNLISYLQTRFVRFLIMQIAMSQHITKNSFSFVPIQNFTEMWTDEKLYAKYKLTKEEIDFVESMIKPY